MKLTGMASTNTVWRALRKLEASGDITVEPGQSRAIRLNGYDIALMKKNTVQELLDEAYTFPVGPFSGSKLVDDA